MQKLQRRTVLLALFQGAVDRRPPSVKELVLRLGAPLSAVTAVLEELEAASLVTAKTARLTFPGLAVAASLAAERVERRSKSRRLAA